MAYTNHANEANTYSPRTSAVSVNQQPVAFLDSFGWTEDTDHNLKRALDLRATHVFVPVDLTGSLAVDMNSSSLPTLDALHQNRAVFNVTNQMAEEAGWSEPLTFVGCVITSKDVDDQETDNMPQVTFEWRGVNRNDNAGGVV